MTELQRTKLFKVALAGLATGIGHFADYVGQKTDHTYLPQDWHPPWADLNDTLAQAQRLVAGTNQGYGDKKPGQRQSIFCSLTGLEEGQSPEGQPIYIPSPTEKYLGFNALKIRGEPIDNDNHNEDIIFPSEAPPSNSAKALWDNFKADLDDLKPIYSQVQEKHLPVYLHNLLNLMQQYTWCIPAPDDKGIGDISLYDYSRMVAAVAVCLSQKPDDEKYVGYLVGGNISGVQKFIYTITSRGATPSLRGRSLYLQLLTEVISRRVLDTFELPPTNLIYGGGGNFYALIPARHDTADTLNGLQKEIDKIFLQHHQGDLYLSVGGKGLTADQFHGQALSTVWQGVGERLQRKKLQPFSQLGGEMADLLFASFETGGDQDKECVVCGREHPKTTTDETGVRKCPPCDAFEKAGDKLRESPYLSLTKIDDTPSSKPQDDSQDDPETERPAEGWQKILAQFGYQVDICETPPSTTAIQEVYALKEEMLSNLKARSTCVVGRKFLVNVTPQLTDDEYNKFKTVFEDLKSNSVKPFGVMAHQAQGIKRLGILRMDVDNLGQIFSKGLADKANLARVATLSFSMNLFFEGCVEHLAERVNQRHKVQRGDLLYSIYAGGDDLFFVGAWDVMPDFARQISQDFQRYAAHHPGLHLSGGLALVPSKYPLYQAAEDAAEAEDAAKGYSGKNAFTFLGQTFPWTRYEEVIAKQTLLDRLITGIDKETGEAHEPVPKSLLQRLLQLYAEYAHEAKKQAKKGDTLGRDGQSQVYWGPWHWHAAYSLTRLAQQVRGKNKAAGETIEKDIRDSLQHENFTEIYWWALAARWTDLLMRSGGADN